MAKHMMHAAQRHKHEKAFDLYSQGDASGKRPSNATLAQMIGVSASAIAYWKRRDGWDSKILAYIDEETAEAEEAALTNRNIRKILRESLFNHIKSLNSLIAFTKNPTDKINAIKAFVHIAKELDCLDPDKGPGTVEPSPRFEDDLPHGPAVSTSEGAARADSSADGARDSVGGPTNPVAEPAVPPADDHPLHDPVYSIPVSEPVRDDLESVWKLAGL